MKQRRFCTTLLALACAGGGLSSSVALAAGLSGQAIMEKVTLTRKLDGSEATVKMSMYDEKGRVREREIAMATKLYDGGQTEKRVYRFLSPADVKGIGILVFDYASKADDMWIFMPAMHKTRRILSSQGTQAFMGSEFTFSDLNIPPLDQFTYSIQKEEACADGDTCWAIDVLPKSKAVSEADGYAKKTYWVSKTKFVVVRGLFYAPDGKLLKELIAHDIKLVDAKHKRYRSLHMEMVNQQNHRRSVFKTTKMSFAPNTKDEYFTTTYIERN
jgi:hypothetical protein